LDLKKCKKKASKVGQEDDLKQVKESSENKSESERKQKVKLCQLKVYK